MEISIGPTGPVSVRPLEEGMSGKTRALQKLCAIPGRRMLSSYIHSQMYSLLHDSCSTQRVSEVCFCLCTVANTLCKRWNWKANMVLWCVKGQKCGAKEKTISRAASYTRNFVSHGASSLPMLAGSRGMMRCRVPLLCRLTNRKKLSMTSAQYIADVLLHRYGQARQGHRPWQGPC